MSMGYKEAGVDIAAGNEVIQRIKPLVEKTFSEHVYTKIGGFGAVFDLKASLVNYKYPLLVQSIDGVGTKTLIASQMHQFDTLGIDLVSATANDIIVMGARPLTLLDYIATDKLEPHIVETIIKGMALACAAEGISLVGGETAEMPGAYQANEYDIAGCITGVVERERIILGKQIRPGDKVWGLLSNGLHTNGYSLARKLFLDIAKVSWDHYFEELQSSVGEALLKPHLNYTRPILHCLEQGVDIKGMAHITGGGLLENIPRILPKGCSVELYKNQWEIPPIFSMMQSLGQVPEQEMFRTFNMGIGLIIILNAEQESALVRCISQFPKFSLHPLGMVVHAHQQVIRIL